MPLYKKQVDDSAYGAGWNGDTTKAPSKNAVYDKIETLGGGGNVSNTGTPVDNQIAVWTNSTTIEGDAALTFDTTANELTIGTTAKYYEGGMYTSDSGTSVTAISFDPGDGTSGNVRGGGFSVTAGHSSGTGRGGDIDFGAGNGGATGAGGFVNIFGGNGGATSGTGGAVSLTAGNATAGNSNGGSIDIIAGNKSGSGTSGILDLETESGKLRLNGALFSPQTSDTVALGSGTLMWSDLFLASGGVLNFNNGNATITHSAGLLTSNVDIAVPDEAYGVGWDGSTEVPTKNAVYDKIQTLGGGQNVFQTISVSGQSDVVADSTTDTLTLVAGTNITITTDAATDSITINASSGGGMTWNEETGTSVTMSVDNAYIANNAALVTLTLPTTAAVGKVVRVVGKGAGLWKIAQNASEIIHFGNLDTTTGTGGYLQATHRRDAVELVCVVADTEWNVISSVGNITVV